jgi:hypothetical protein
MTGPASPKRRHVVCVAGMPASDGAAVRLERVIGEPQCGYLDALPLLDAFRNGTLAAAE